MRATAEPRGELVNLVDDRAAPTTPTGKCGEPDGARSKLSDVLGKIFLGGVDVLSPFLLRRRPFGPMEAADEVVCTTCGWSSLLIWSIDFRGLTCN